MFFFKYFYFFLLILHTIHFGMQEERAHEVEYNQLIIMPKRRINTLYFFGSMSGLAAIWFLARHNYYKILKGEDYTFGWLKGLNAYKDSVCKVSLWAKNAIIPLLAYGEIGRLKMTKNELEFKDKNYGKVLILRNGIKKDALPKMNVDNFFDNSLVANIMHKTDWSRVIFYKIRDGIEISSEKVKKIFNLFGIEGEGSGYKCYFGLHSYFYSTSNKDYYKNIALFEKEMEDPDRQEKKILNFEKINIENQYNQDNQYKKKVFEKNEELYVKFKMKKNCYIFVTIILTVALLSSIYSMVLLKEYIETYGLGHGDFLTTFLKDYQWYKTAGLICSNLDWIYWFLGIAEYGILPLGIVFLLSAVINFYKNNKNIYNINKIVIEKNNLLNIQNPDNEASRKKRYTDDKLKLIDTLECLNIFVVSDGCKIL